MKRMLILLIVLCNSIIGYGKECTDTTFVNSYAELVRCINASNTEKILLHSEQLISRLESAGLKDCELYFSSKFHRGQGLELNSQIDEAIAIYHEIIPECKSRNLLKIVAESYLSLARVYEQVQRPRDCVRNLDLALEIITENNFEDLESRHAIRYSSYQRIYKDKAIARHYVQKAIQLGLKHNVNRSIVDGYLLAGIVAEESDSAIHYFNKAELKFLDNQNFDAAASMASNQASQYLSSFDYDSASNAVDRAFNYQKLVSGRDFHYYAIQERLFRMKESIAKTQGNIDSAYVYSNKARENEKLADLDVDQQKINEMEINFAIEQEKARTQNIRLITKILIAGFVIFILLSGILALYYFRLRIRSDLIVKQSGIIESNNDKLRSSNKEKELLLSEIHHRVKNNLQLVISLLAMYSRNFNDAEMKDHFEAVSEKVMSISLIHEQLYKNEDYEVIDMEEYLSELKSKYEVLHVDDRINISTTSDEISFNIETVMPLGIIVTELLNNSIKYALNHKNILQVYIELQRQGKKYILTYKDNGPGYPTGHLDSNGKTVGGFLVTSMVRQLLAESKSYNNNGAVLEMKFKEKLTSEL